MLKKTLLSLLVIIFIQSVVYSQIPTAPNKIDIDSLKQGKWVVLYNAFDIPVDAPDKAKTYTVADYEDGKVQGKVSVYWITGELKAKYQLLSEEPFIYDGEYVDYYKNGQVKSKGLHKEGEEIGEWEHYFDDGSIDSSFAIYQKACELYFEGNYAEALPLHEKALKIKEDKLGTQHMDYLGILHDVATTSFGVGKHREAIDILRNLLKTIEENYGVNNPEYLQGLFDLSSLCFQIYDIESAENYIKEYMSLLVANKGDMNQEYLSATEILVSIYNGTGRHLESKSLLEKYLNIMEKLSLKNTLQYANAYYYLGDIYGRMGDPKKAIEYMEESLEMIKAVSGEEHIYYIGIMPHLGRMYVELGQYATAEEIYLRSMAKAKEAVGPELSNFGMIPYYLGSLYIYMGRYSEAEPLIKQAINIDIRDNGESHPFNYWTLADLSAKIGKFSEAESTFKKAIELIKNQSGEKSASYAKCRLAFADVLIRMGRYAEAEEICNNSIEIFNELYNTAHPDLVSSYNILTNIYNKTNRIGKTITISDKIIKMQVELFGEEHPENATLIGNLAATYDRLNQNDKADSLFKLSLSIFELNPDYNKRAELRIKSNFAYFMDKMERYKEAELLWKEINNSYKKLIGENHPQYANNQFQLARHYMLAEKNKSAANYFTSSISNTFVLTDRYFPSLSESEKMLFWNSVSGRIECFNSFASLYCKEQPDILKNMYDYSLMSKGLILEAKKKSLTKARSMSKLLKNWQATREYWMKLIQNPQKAKQMGVSIDSVEKAANEYEKALSSQSTDMKKLLDTTKIRWQDVKAMLKDNEAAIEIIRFRKFDKVITDKVQYAALILKNRKDKPIELVLLQNGNDIEDLLLKQYTKHIQKQKNKGFSGLEDYLLKEIYNQIWSDIDKKLDGIETIYLSPDGVFNKINLNTLINPETGKFLIDELNIHLMTSTRDLSDKSKFKVYGSLMMPENNAVLFGNPAFNLNYIDDGGMNSQKLYAGTSLKRVLSESMERGAITSLPGTEKEINLISEQLNNKQWKTETFFGKNALEENIKSLESPKILHIATHGVFLEDLETEKSTLGIENERYIENPLLRSMLLFAGAARTISGATGGDSPERDINDINGGSWGEDGILTAYEVINLDLEGTELVVLSACKTGLGEVKNGEGVYGLQRAFQVAGAKTIIMSLWSVDDKTTQELMTSFYEKWLSGMNKREAFNKAQAEMKSKYSQPYYWGAFVMVGE